MKEESFFLWMLHGSLANWLVAASLFSAIMMIVYAYMLTEDPEGARDMLNPMYYIRKIKNFFLMD
jgi:hypothetical protein